MGIRFAGAVFIALMAGCSDGAERYDGGAAEGVAETAAEIGDEARQAVYAEYGADSGGTGADTSNVDPYEVEDHGNYVCTEDCSGHQAGFEWAQENDIEDGANCGGNSQSFIEGCEAFATERQEQADRDAQEAAELAAAEAEAEAEAGAEYDAEG